MKTTTTAILSALFLGAAASAGTATYDLSRPYAPYLTATETTIWENRSLADIESFTCTVKGGWIGTATAGIGVIYDRTPTSFTVQLQCVNGGVKTVRAYFRQDGANIVARADRAGRDTNESHYGTRLDDSLFTTALATSDSADGYGAYGIEAFGDVAQTISAFPDGTDAVVVSGGILQINVAGDSTISTPISGNGGLRFRGPGEPVETQHTFNQYVTTANQTFVENTDVFDLEITSAVFNGGWCGRGEGAKPYNVTSNLAAKTMTVQLQNKQGTWNNLFGFVVELSQSGDDVLIKGLITRKAGEGQEEGSDVYEWNGASPSIATSASGNGYGLESISFVKRALPAVILDGTKSWTGGTVADGCKVKVVSTQLAARTTSKAVNGGMLELAAAGVWNVFPQNTFVATTNSTIRITAAFAINQYDTMRILGGMVECNPLNNNCYFNDVLFSGGAAWSGSSRTQVGYQQNATWTTEGDEGIEIFAPLRLVANNTTREFTLDTGADIVFHEALEENSNYPGATFAKRGAAKVTFEAGGAITGPLRLEGGSIAFGGDAEFGSLAVAGSTAIEIDAGVALSFASSSGASWTAGERLDITGAFDESNHVMRFGTDATGLTAAQLSAIRVNGSRCVLDESGWLHPVAQAFVITVR